MTHRDEDEEIIDTALDTLAWQRREIDRLKAEVEGLSRIARLMLDACDIMDDGPDESDERMAQERMNEAVSLARTALGEKQ